MGPTMNFLLDNLGSYGYWVNKDYIYGYTCYNIILNRDNQWNDEIWNDEIWRYDLPVGQLRYEL